jgi:hypothetical protein
MSCGQIINRFQIKILTGPLNKLFHATLSIRFATGVLHQLFDQQLIEGCFFTCDWGRTYAPEISNDDKLIVQSSFLFLSFCYQQGMHVLSTAMVGFLLGCHYNTLK